MEIAQLIEATGWVIKEMPADSGVRLEAERTLLSLMKSASRRAFNLSHEGEEYED